MKELIYEKNELSAKLVAAEAKVFHFLQPSYYSFPRFPPFYNQQNFIFIDIFNNCTFLFGFSFYRKRENSQVKLILNPSKKKHLKRKPAIINPLQERTASNSKPIDRSYVLMKLARKHSGILNFLFDIFWNHFFLGEIGFMQ